MNYSIAILQLVIFLFSVIIHEISHGYVAEMLGDPTARREGRLTLNPISHIDPVGSIVLPLVLFISGLPIFGWAKPVPYNPYNLRNPKVGGGLIGAAGPLSNILFAGLFTLALRGFDHFWVLNPITTMLINNIITINIVLAVFNLVPLPPLDGSKVLFALLPHKFFEIQIFLERYSLPLFLLFIFFGFSFIQPVIDVLLSLFLFHP
ncbi:MAG: site-2 protease family protein [Parcubacteria group bacterium]|nr:site-2 protease family protein [Parcubacteria group bacterium]